VESLFKRILKNSGKPVDKHENHVEDHVELHEMWKSFETLYIKVESHHKMRQSYTFSELSTTYPQIVDKYVYAERYIKIEKNLEISA
jgi:hypothetical protein